MKKTLSKTSEIMKHNSKKSDEFIISKTSVIVNNQNDIANRFNNCFTNTAKNWINKIEE